MTIYEGYIGSLDDPNFKWEGGNWSGNIPTSISPNLPPLPNSSENLYFKVADLIESGRCPGKKTEWGAYVAVVTKSQLQTIFSEWYGANGSLLKNSDYEHWHPNYIKVMEFVSRLEEQTPYALVGTEL